jgi:hypothetical protein
MNSTEPLSPICLASSLAAATPPASLSEEIRDRPIEGSVTIVSTRIVLMPLSCAALSGLTEALSSFGAISSASGFFAVTESMIGFCSVASNAVGPCTSRVTLSAFAGAALHGDVERLPALALDQGDALTGGRRRALARPTCRGGEHQKRHCDDNG